jgi:polar amino acid transport system substrate-binding protein
MKRISFVIVSLLWISTFLAACSGNLGGAATPATSDKGLAPGSLKIGTNASLAPFETLDMSNNTLGGFDIELIQAIAKQGGLELAFFNVPSNQVLGGVAQCQYEAGISAIPITDELRQYMLFSDPYYTTGHVVVVKEGNLTIAGREDLAGKTVGVASGSPAAAEILNIPGVQAKVYDSSSLAFQDLINGYIQAVIEDAPHALSYVAIKANNLKIVGDEFSNVQYGIAVCKKRPDLLKKINDGLAAIQAEGAFDKLAKKWNLEAGQ